METIVRSRVAMIFATVAAGVYALGSLCALLAFVTISESSQTAFTDLGHASDWLHFGGALLVLVGLCVVVRDAMLAQKAIPLIEVVSATIATLLLAIGGLVGAASSSSGSTADVLEAVGLGLWGLLVLSRAARITMDQAAQPALRRQSGYWLGASIGLVVMAVGVGFVYALTDKSSSITSGVISALGVIVLAGALTVARIGGLLKDRTAQIVTSGLFITGAYFVAAAVAAGIEFSTPTLTGLRVTFAIVYAIGVVGVLTLGMAAWMRVQQLPGTAAPSQGMVPFPPTEPNPS